MTRIFAMTLFFAAASSAWAHAFIEQAEPAVGSTVKSAPSEVRILFTMMLDVRECRLQVYDAPGKSVGKGDLHADPKEGRRVILSLSSGLAAGTYKVVWRARPTGEGEEHVTKGEYTFQVGP